MLTLNGSGLLQQAVESAAAGSGRVPPSNVTAPELAGAPEVGKAVSARPGIWAGLPVPEIRTTLFVDGSARRSPCLLRPEDDGKEILVTDVASNGTGQAVVSSSRTFVRHPLPYAMGAPEDVSIEAEGASAVVDAGMHFVGTSGGQWSATFSAGADALQLEIDETGRVTIAAGTLTGSTVVTVTYANSGGSASTMFSVSSGDFEPISAPQYDGSLGDLSITSGESISIEAGLAFSGAELLFSVSGLPDGLAADPATGRIAGQTTQAGSYSIAVRATNPAGLAEALMRLDVIETSQPIPGAPSYDGSLQPQKVTVGAAFELTAGTAFTGKSLTFAATGLPSGLGIDAESGTISGELSNSGEFAIMVTASNSGGTVSGTFPLTVAEPLVAPVYAGSLNAMEAALGDAFTLSAGGAFTGDELSFSAYGLASGLTIDAATGQIAGTPTTRGTFATTITAKNSAGEASGSFQLVVTAPGAVTPAAPTYNGGLTNQSFENNIAAQTRDVTPFFSNTTGGTWGIESDPPGGGGVADGISINQSGIESREPLPLPEGSWAVTVLYDDGMNPRAEGTYTLTITPEVVGERSAAPSYDGGLELLTLAPVDLPYDASVHFSGSGTLTYSATGLPAGVTIGSSTGVISGTFTGTSTATVSASNGTAPDASGTLGFSGAAGSATTPSYTSGASNKTYTKGVAITPLDVSAWNWNNGGAAITSYAMSPVPAGLSFNTSTGVLSGTPTTNATTSVTVTATNSAGTSTNATFDITVQAAASASVVSHDLAIDTNNATLDIGAHDASSRVWATVFVAGVDDAGFTTSGGPTATTVATVNPVSLRTIHLEEITGTTGSTVAASWGGATENVATFRTKGLQPVATGAISYARKAASDMEPGEITVTVPAGGAVLLHGARYHSFSATGATISPDESIAAAPQHGCRGAWLNDTGRPVEITVTYTVSSSITEKYAILILMEPA